MDAGTTPTEGAAHGHHRHYPGQAPSVEAILDALRQHPDAAAAELAEATGIGRSTAGKTLASLEAQGRVTRQRGTSEAGKPTPDGWMLVSDRDRAQPEPQPAAAEVAVDEPAATTESRPEASSADAVPPVAVTPALGLAADRRRSEWPWRHRLRDTSPG